VIVESYPPTCDYEFLSRHVKVDCNPLIVVVEKMEHRSLSNFCGTWPRSYSHELSLDELRWMFALTIVNTTYTRVVEPRLGKFSTPKPSGV
jgi:hypothetical protein